MGEQRDIASLTDSGLPLRVREVATRLLHATESELSDRIQLMLRHLETHLFKQAERARSPADQVELLKAVQTVKTQGGQFQPAYFKQLESQLAQLRSNPSLHVDSLRGKALPSSQWTVHDAVPEKETAAAQLRDLAAPLEGAANLSLYLLGQRFGVLAGSPALSPTQICLGPRTLIQLAGDVAQGLFKERVSPASVQSHFAQEVLGDYAGFIERINELLDDAGVLPGLTYVPTRPTKASKTTPPSSDATPPEEEVATASHHAGAASPTGRQQGAQHAASGAAASHQPAGHNAGQPGPTQGHHGQPQGQTGGASPTPSWGRDDVTNWLEQPDLTPLVSQPPQADFRYLQQLLTAQRIAGKLPPRPTPPPGAEIDTAEVDRLLHEIQSQPPSDANQTRSIHGLRESLLQRARAEHGPQANLGREDADTFEILSILYAEVAREVRAGSSVHGLLERLQLPVLRLALKDRGFFEETAHPGRQLLNTIAESDASAYGDHAIDPYFEIAMRKAVERMEDNFHGQPEVLAEVNDELQSQFRQQVKRSQSNEKRLVEAARGRERMALAKQTATDALQSLMDQQKPPRSIEVLMRRAWLDAMTLTALRHGETSPAWQKQLDTTRQILETVTAPEPVQSPELAKDIDTAMRQVGYHETEANALSRHLSRSNSAPREDDEPTATEISARIKAHTRLGEEDVESREEKIERAKLPTRTPAEEECYRHLRTLPFGCWIDFIQNQQGEAERRRLSWYSTVTDRALFVNRRGQRVAEMHMDALSRLMAQGQLRVVERHQLRLIDRAFRSTVEMLRNTLRGNDDRKQEQWTAPAT